MYCVSVRASDSTGNRAAGSCESASRGEVNEEAVGTGKGESGGEPVGRCIDGKQAAGCDGYYGERAAGYDGSDVERVNQLRSCCVRIKRRRRCFVLFAEFDYFVSES